MPPRRLACKPRKKDELKDGLKVQIIDFAQRTSHDSIDHRPPVISEGLDIYIKFLVLSQEQLVDQLIEKTFHFDDLTQI